MQCSLMRRKIRLLNQPAHSCSLIRIFTGHILDSIGCKVFFMQTTKTDQTVWMCRLIWCTYQKVCFLPLWLESFLFHHKNIPI